MMQVEQAKMIEFQRKWDNGEIHAALRYGQALHQFLKLEKTTHFKAECDRLYNVSNDKVQALIKSFIEVC